MNTKFAKLEAKLQLPAIRIHNAIPYKTFRSSYSYGSLHIASAYCQISYRPWLLNFFWQHGCIPPWQNLHPIAVTYGINPNEMIFVARDDQAKYLLNNGYPKVQAIGIPICYVIEEKVERLADSLLVMPPHVLQSQKGGSKKEMTDYIDFIESVKDNFDLVVACINQNCLEKGFWVDDFERIGVATVRGAHPMDENALIRQRKLYQIFETMTTPSYGSHIPYALDSGCKVSIYGPRIMLKMDDVMKDTTWGQIPEIAYKLLIEDDYGLNTERDLQKFKIDPSNSVADIAYGSFMIGRAKKITPHQMKNDFRWNNSDFVLHYSRYIRNRVQLRTRLKNMIN